MYDGMSFKIKNSKRVKFSEINENDYFTDNNLTLFRKIKKSELEFFNIDSINSINVENGGFTKFSEDEKVIRVERKFIIGI